MIRDTSSPSNRRSGGIHDPATVESQILKHVPAIHQSLLEIGANKLDLAQRITAAFRRTLPALRVASKWLLANLKYVAPVESDASDDSTFSVHIDASVTETDLIAALSDSTCMYRWSHFRQFHRTHIY
jgi:hypothetical protein